MLQVVKRQLQRRDGFTGRCVGTGTTGSGGDPCAVATVYPDGLRGRLCRYEAQGAEVTGSSRGHPWQAPSVALDVDFALYGVNGLYSESISGF